MIFMAVDWVRRIFRHGRALRRYPCCTATMRTCRHLLVRAVPRVVLRAHLISAAQRPTGPAARGLHRARHCTGLKPVVGFSLSLTDGRVLWASSALVQPYFKQRSRSIKMNSSLLACSMMNRSPNLLLLLLLLSEVFVQVILCPGPTNAMQRWHCVPHFSDSSSHDGAGCPA